MGCPSNEGLDDDVCRLCRTEDLSRAPSVRLECNHVFHYHCLQRRLRQKWNGSRIRFDCLNCILCKQEMYHPFLIKQMNEIANLYAIVCVKTKQNLMINNMTNDRGIRDATSMYFNDPLRYGLASFAYYQCSLCQKVYYGGKRATNDDRTETHPHRHAVSVGAPGSIEVGLEAEYVCYDCSKLPSSSYRCVVPAHRECQRWKCRYCCNEAVWFCGGVTHYCDRCHGTPVVTNCAGGDNCPLKVSHPPNGTREFSLGCLICPTKSSND